MNIKPPCKADKRIISPVIYYGGKSVLAPWIVSHFPEHDVYVELFGGGASVLLAKTRCPIEIYNDKWDRVVNFFRVVRDHGPELKEKLKLTPYAYGEYKNALERPWPTDQIENARRFLIASRQAFGGCGTTWDADFYPGRWRRPSITKYNHHCGHSWAALPDRIDQLVDRFQAVVIDNCDFEKLIDRYDSPSTLFYADPPYLKNTRSRPDHEYMFDFSVHDYRRLAKALSGIKGKTIVSNYDHDYLEQLFPNWERADRTHFKGGRAKDDNSRAKTKEILLMNYKCGHKPEGP